MIKLIRFVSLLIFIICILGDSFNCYAINHDREIFHLDKKEFKEFFKKAEFCDWDEHFFKEHKCEKWNYDFFVWDKGAKKALIPKRLDLKEDFIRDLETFYEEKEQQSRQTLLISKDEMMLISLKFMKDGIYSHIYSIKRSCNVEKKEDGIIFYIFDTRDNNMIYFCKKDLMLNYAPEPPGINLDSLRESLKPDNLKKIKFCLKITGVIGDRCLSTIISSNDNEIKCYDKRNSNSDIIPKGRNKENDTPYPFKKFPFDLADITDVDVLKTEGIWVGKGNDKEDLTLVTYSSLYSLIKDRYEETNKQLNPEHDIVLFLARTSNFKINKSVFTQKIEAELREIGSALKQFIKCEKGKKIKIIGYADREGMDNDEEKWRTTNIEVSKGRAYKVKDRLEKELRGLIIKDNIVAIGCDKDYYTYKDSKFVEIRVY